MDSDTSSGEDGPKQALKEVPFKGGSLADEPPAFGEPEPEQEDPFEYFALELIGRAPPDVASRLMQLLHAPQPKPAKTPKGSSVAVQTEPAAATLPPRIYKLGSCVRNLCTTLLVLLTIAVAALHQQWIPLPQSTVPLLSPFCAPTAAASVAPHTGPGELARRTQRRLRWRHTQRERGLRRELAVLRRAVRQASPVSPAEAAAASAAACRAEAPPVPIVDPGPARIREGPAVGAAELAAGEARPTSAEPRSEAAPPPRAVRGICARQRADGSCAEWVI